MTTWQDLQERYTVRFTMKNFMLFKGVLFPKTEGQLFPKKPTSSLGFSSLSYPEPETSTDNQTVTQYEDGGTTYEVRTFTGSGVLTVDSSLEVDYLIVAGGGGGGTYRGGGGGAGGIIEGTTTISSDGYTIIVGTGGQGGSLNLQATVGDISTAFGLTAFGGGGGGLGWNGENAGLDGGSGGGEGGAAESGAQGAGTTLDFSQGNDGGAAYLNQTSDPRNGGGGGGAGASGSNATSTTSGSGGIGIISSITGTNKYYAGGGGGAGNSLTEASGGLGGGGNGSFSTDASNGLNSTGGGGGGAGGGAYSSNKGGNGGSGVVIIRYPIS